MPNIDKKRWHEVMKNRNKNYELWVLLYLYTSFEYDFIILFFSKNTYITMDNISVSRKGFCLKDVPNTL